MKDHLEHSMRGSFFSRLPPELILQCLRRLDAKSLVQLCIAYQEMSNLAQDKSLCIHLCHNDPTASALIKAADIENELRDGTIDAYAFLTSFVNKDFPALESLLSSKKNRHFVLWVACYETGLLFFPKSSPESPRPLFLTKQIGESQTPNAKKVKAWLAVTVPADEVSLPKLVSQFKTPYQECIPDASIQRFPS